MRAEGVEPALGRGPSASEAGAYACFATPARAGRIGRFVRPGLLLLAPNLGLPFACVVRLELEGTELRPRAATETGSRVRSQTLTTRSNCSIMRASSGGVIQLAFIHSRASSVAPRATAHPFQT